MKYPNSALLHRYCPFCAEILALDKSKTHLVHGYTHTTCHLVGATFALPAITLREVEPGAPDEPPTR